MLYLNKERVTEVIETAKNNNVEFRLNEQQLSFGTKQKVLANSFDYLIADSLVYMQGTPTFQVLKLKADSLSLLGAFAPNQQRTLFHRVRKPK